LDGDLADVPRQRLGLASPAERVERSRQGQLCARLSL
jgi:hypothetical protein